MREFKKIIQEKAKHLRQQFNLGNYCGRSIFDVIEKIETDGGHILLFRLPFQNNELAGFVGYKNNRFAIYTNTNKNFGYEVFTAAHEIYHIVENSAMVKENVVLAEEVINEQDKKSEQSEVLADMFAAELLMPEEDISSEYNRLLHTNALEKPDESIIIALQQQYFVEYKAVTKRLKEIESVNFDEGIERNLNRILYDENELFRLTIKLGYTNDLNKPSEIKVYLPKLLLKRTEENYRNAYITMDDLTVLFGYCDSLPQDFGYEEEELSDNAKALMERIRLELGSEGIGKE